MRQWMSPVWDKTSQSPVRTPQKKRDWLFLGVTYFFRCFTRTRLKKYTCIMLKYVDNPTIRCKNLLHYIRARVQLYPGTQSIVLWNLRMQPYMIVVQPLLAIYDLHTWQRQVYAPPLPCQTQMVHRVEHDWSISRVIHSSTLRQKCLSFAIFPCTAVLSDRPIHVHTHIIPKSSPETGGPNSPY